MLTFHPAKMMLSAILVGILVSSTLLFFPSRFSMALQRSVPGSDIAAVTRNIGDGESHYLYARLGDLYPEAEYIVLSPVGKEFRPLQFLPAFAVAGRLCMADEATEAAWLLDMTRFPSDVDWQPPHFLWIGTDLMGNRSRIHTGGQTDRFLFVEGRDIDVIGVDLLSSPLEQRCDDER